MQTFFRCSVQFLKEYPFSAVNAVSVNPSSGPLPRIKISFFLLSTCTYELISVPKIIKFLPNPLPDNEKLPHASNSVPHPKYLYLSKSVAILINSAKQRTS